MEIRREPLTFALTAALLGLLTWGLVGEAGRTLPRPRWSAKGLEVPAQRTPDPAGVPSPRKSTASELKRDLFGEPKDTRPLPPLVLGDELEPPPADPYAWLSPPPVPGPAIRLWSKFLRAPATPVEFSYSEPAPVTDGDAPAGAGASNGSAPPDAAKPESKPDPKQDPKADSKPATGPAASPKLTPPDEVLEKLYDRLVPKTGLVIWGRIKSPNRFDLKENDPILFQQFDVVKGVPFGAPYAWPRADVLRYDFAKTILNQIELRRRKTPWIAGNESQIRDFGLWCLERGSEEPAAFVEAEKQLRKAYELAPGDPASSLALGRLLEATFRFEEAWRLYGDMTEGPFKANADAWVARAELEARMFLMHDAEAHLRRAAEVDSSSYRPKLTLGELLLKHGRAADARRALEGAMAAEPSGVENASMRARIRRRLAEAELSEGDLDAAAAKYKLALDSDRADDASTIGLAVIDLLRKKPRPAIDALNSVIERKPTAESLVARGLAKIAVKDFIGARADFEAAVGLDPLRDVRPLSALAYLLLATGHPEDAAASVERALANDPTDAYALYLQGRLLRDKGQVERAISVERQAAMADLGFVDPLVELGLLVEQQPESVDDANLYFLRAFELDPKNADIAALRGLNLLAAKQPRRAREAFLQATAIDRDHPLARNGLALCDYLEDDSKAAKQGLRAVIDTPTAGEIHRKVAKETLDRILIHEKKVEWNDPFDRTALRGEWDTARVLDVEVGIENGEVRIQGVFQQTGEARLERRKEAIPQRLLLAFEADVTIPVATDRNKANQSEVELFARDEGGLLQGKPVTRFELGVLRERGGLVKVIARTSEEPVPAKQTSFSWPEGKTVRVKIERNDDDEHPLARIVLDDQIVVSDVKLPRGGSGKFILGVSASGDAGHAALVAIDNVRIVKKTE